MSDLGPESDAAGWELASAYLDDDVDAAARARVESSPALLALVAELRGLRDGLATPAPAPAAARESAIAAALAAFDAGDAEGAVAQAAGSPGAVQAGVHDLAARRRRRSTWLVGAAAAVIVVVVGVVALNGGGGAGTDFSASKQAVPTAGDAADSRAVTGEAAPAAAPATTDAAAATTAAGTVAAAGTIAAATDDASGGAAGPSIAATTAIASLTSPAQLLDLPRPEIPTSPSADTGTATGSPVASTAAPATTTAAPSVRCVRTPTVLLAMIEYQGTAAVAVVDDVRHVREALRATDCTVLAEVPDGP